MLATVLLVDENVCEKLSNRLYQLGYHVKTSASMPSTLFKLRHEPLKAVFICCETTDIDAVELLLNIRDINPHIPFVLVNCPVKKRELQWILNQKSTFSINTNRLSTHYLHDILKTG